MMINFIRNFVTARKLAKAVRQERDQVMATFVLSLNEERAQEWRKTTIEDRSEVCRQLMEFFYGVCQQDFDRLREIYPPSPETVALLSSTADRQRG
jgi:hypothetical protein